MQQTLEHRIRERAYQIWHANGQSDGQANEHWLTAEREVLSSLSIDAVTIEASAPAKSQKRARGASRKGSARAKS